MYARTRQNNRKVQDFYKQQEESAEIIVPKSIPISGEQKVQLRKKDRVALKRKTKQEPLKQLGQKTQAQNSSVQHNQQSKSQQFSSHVAGLDRENEPSNFFEEEPSKEPYQLQKIIRKPNYIKLQGNSIIKGYAGHSSVIFKRPILQGSYYFEVKILKSLQNDSNLKFPPSIRIGLCPHDYPHTIPLGGKESFCYRSIDGELIENKKKVKFGPSYGEGDLIGIQVKIGAPHKHPVKQWRNEQSKVTFYKNGEKVGQYENLKQIFYTVGVSVFNYANIEIRIDPDVIQRLPEGFEPYLQSLHKQIAYKDLKSSRIFNE